jgi:hypothetical protein
MVSTLETAHVAPHLRNDRLSALAGNAGDGVQQFNRFFKWDARFANLLIEAGNRFIY